MKKMLSLILLGVLFLASLAKADCPCQLAQVTLTSSALPGNVALMFSKYGQYPALTYTTSTTPYTTAVQGPVTIKKLWIEAQSLNFTGSANQYTPVPLTVTVWDAPNGNTLAAGAKMVRQYFVAVTPNYPRWTDDFTLATGLSKDGDGLLFKYAPTIVDGQANSASVYILWDQKPKNLVIPGYTQ